MAIELELEQRRFVQKLVDVGRYASEAEVISVGIELVRDRELRLQELDESLERSVAESKSGRTRPAEDVFDELEARIRSRMAARAAA